MAEATGTDHTLLGTNALQGTVDKLDTVVDKLSSAADKMATAAARSSSGRSAAAGGMWNQASLWLRGQANGGGATFNGQPGNGTTNPSSSGGSHRASGPTQTPGWAQTAGNFTQAMANGNGGQGVNGAYKIGASLGGTKTGMAFAAGSLGLSLGSWVANNGASQQDMYNWNMLGGTATRMFNQGIGGAAGPRFGMSGVAGSQDASDFYSSMYLLNSKSGFLQGSGQASKMQAQAGAMGYMNPTTNMTQNTQAMIGLSSNTTTNLMRAFGINTYGNDPTQIARQLLDRLGAPKGKIDPKVIQMVLAPQSGLSATLGNMVAAGALSQDQADAVKTAAYNILVAQNQGMTSKQLDTLTQQASGSPRDASTKAAQSKLKALGLGTSTAQTMMNKGANQTDDSVAQLGTFASALHDSTVMLQGFANWLNKATGGALQNAAGANSGAGGGWMGKIFGGASFIKSPFGSGMVNDLPGISALSNGLNVFGKGDGLIASSGSSIGGGDSSLSGEGYSELGALVGSAASGPGFVGAGFSATSTGTSTSGGSVGSSEYNSAPSSHGGGAPSGNPGGGNGSPNYGTTQGIPLGRVSPGQAIARIRGEMSNHVDIGVGMCQANAHRVYGIGNGAPSAVAAWNAAKYKHSFKDSPPVGAFVFWGGGFGHVAIYAGGGKVYSPGGPGDLSHWVLCSISAITSGWNKPLLGWTEDNNGVRVVKPATTQKGSPSTTGHHGGSTHSTGGHTQVGKGSGVAMVTTDPYTGGGLAPGGAAGMRSHMILPGVVSGATGSTVSGGRGRGASGAQIVFQKDSVHIHIDGGADTITAATGRSLGQAFAQEFAQDQRIKSLMAGTRNG